MADEALTRRILLYFEAEGGEVKTSQLSAHLKTNRRKVNSQLYQLEENGDIERVQESPPIWRLIAKASGSGTGESRAERKTVSEELLNVILAMLQQKRVTMSSIEIARAVDMKKVSDVQPTLISMEKQRLVKKVKQRPATWALNETVSPLTVVDYGSDEGDINEGHSIAPQTEDQVSMGSDHDITQGNEEQGTCTTQEESPGLSHVQQAVLDLDSYLSDSVMSPESTDQPAVVPDGSAINTQDSAMQMPNEKDSSGKRTYSEAFIEENSTGKESVPSRMEYVETHTDSPVTTDVKDDDMLADTDRVAAVEIESDMVTNVADDVERQIPGIVKVEIDELSGSPSMDTSPVVDDGEALCAASIKSEPLQESEPSQIVPPVTQMSTEVGGSIKQENSYRGSSNVNIDNPERRSPSASMESDDRILLDETDADGSSSVMESKTIVKLAECTHGQSTSDDLSKHFGFYARDNVTSTLYDLQSKGHVIKVVAQPPTWRITEKGKAFALSIGGSFQTRQASFSSVTTQRGIPAPPMPRVPASLPRRTPQGGSSTSSGGKSFAPPPSPLELLRMRGEYKGSTEPKAAPRPSFGRSSFSQGPPQQTSSSMGMTGSVPPPPIPGLLGAGRGMPPREPAVLSIRPPGGVPHNQTGKSVSSYPSVTSTQSFNSTGIKQQNDLMAALTSSAAKKDSKREDIDVEMTQDSNRGQQVQPPPALAAAPPPTPPPPPKNLGLKTRMLVDDPEVINANTNDNMDDRVLMTLAEYPNSVCSSLDLAKSFGFYSKKNVNPALYSLQKKGFTARIKESPPTWQVTPAGRDYLVIARQNPQNRPSVTSLSNKKSEARPKGPRPPAHLLRFSQGGNRNSSTGSSFTPPPNPLELMKLRGEFKGTPSMPSQQPKSYPAMNNSSSIPSLMQMKPSQSVASVMRTATPNNVPVPPPGSLSKPINALAALTGDTFAALNKNPVSALMEYAQSRKCTAKIEVIGQRGPSHNPKFTVAAFVGSRQFPPVEVRNKKDGKKEAADQALRVLMAEGQFQPQPSQKASSLSIPAFANGQATNFDNIAALSHQAFNTLAASVPESLSGRKVLAALIMKMSPTDTGAVISLGTGNRCITGHELSLEGSTVNDSHAEIITRRGFMRFLYRQLESYDPSDSDSIFETGRTGKMKIKDNITFHLYISTAPCGDGALFSPRDAGANKLNNADNSEEHQPTFTSKVMGVLRTKMEGGEGTIPIELDFKGQTWDGILRGERLRTMSCSDKICRWNLLGMQGALLSHFLEPIYLSSLTLGFLYDHAHLSRAVCCRLGLGEPLIEDKLPAGFKINHPRLGRVTIYEPQRETEKTKSMSVNWCLGDQRPEVSDGTKGRPLTQGVFISQVAKSKLYTCFKSVCQKFNRQDLLEAECYFQAKKMASDFQTAKALLYEKFRMNKFGPWVKKPVEEEMF